MHSGRFFRSWYIYEISVQPLCERVVACKFFLCCFSLWAHKRRNADLWAIKRKKPKCCSTWGLVMLSKSKHCLVCKGGLDKVTPALQVVIIRYLLGDFNKGNNRMNSSSGSRCSILDFVLAVVVTLGRCERCWSGALSRNSHRGSINLWCPADKRPTDRLGAVTLGNIQSGFLAALGWIFAKRSLTHSWVRLSTSHPRRAVNRWATTQCPLRLAAMQLWVGCVSTLRTLRVSRVGVWH